MWSQSGRLLRDAGRHPTADGMHAQRRLAGADGYLAPTLAEGYVPPPVPIGLISGNPLIVLLTES